MSSEFKIIDVAPQVESVTIITPTIGSDYLPKNIDSVQMQNFSGKLTHLIVVDGAEKADIVEDKMSFAAFNNKEGFRHLINKCVLPENVGGKGFYGHRVYAAFSFLINTDAVIFLDEDNWLEPSHVQDLVDALNSGPIEWAYSLRKIYDKEGNYLLDDNCESLGAHPAYTGVNHVDTSAYIVRTESLVKVCGAWYGKWGADRQFLSALAAAFPQAGATQKHTLCYRLDGNEGSVTKEFFEQGNKKMKERYPDSFPWVKV